MIERLKDKKIAILGFGKEGRAVLAYLNSHGIPVQAVLDSKEAPDDEGKVLLGSVPYVGGSSYLGDLSNYDLLFRSPGIPRMHPALVSYHDQEAVYSMTKLFFDICPCPIVAVTGSKGKTTTTSLIFEILKGAGKNVFLGGNIGEPLLNFVDQLDSGGVAVVELSSFQAQDLHKSPHVGVILNVTSDHLDDGSFRAASHSTQEEYVQAKAQMIANQAPDDFAIIHPSLPEIFSTSGAGKKVIFDPNDVRGYERKLLGDHNLENIAAAVKACEALGVTDDAIRDGVKNFSGVPQRLEVVSEKDGVRFVNDSASTNPDSTEAAIDSFKENVVLIIGGSDKQLDYANLGQKIQRSPQVISLVVVGEVTQKLMDATKEFKGKVLVGARNMHEIVAQAKSLAQPGDVVLLSPAAASFDMFQNSKDRGNQFTKEVHTQ